MNNTEKRIPDITIENARIIYRNFEGREVKLDDGRVINKKGDRNVCLVIPEDYLEKVKEVGWNIKLKKKRDPEEDDVWYLPIKVKYSKREDGSTIGPIASLITSRGQTRLTENTIGQLDWARIKNVDIQVRGWAYPPSNINPEGGIASYLKAIYVTIQEDRLEEKYANIPYAEGDDEEETPFE